MEGPDDSGEAECPAVPAIQRSRPKAGCPGRGLVLRRLLGTQALSQVPETRLLLANRGQTTSTSLVRVVCASDALASRAGSAVCSCPPRVLQVLI